MAFPTGPGPNPPAIGLALAAILAAERRPALGGALAGLTALFRIELGIAAAIGAILAAHPESACAPVSARLAVGVLCLAPFFIVAPEPMAHDLFGFYGIQSLQRVPFPLDFDGPVRPSKLIEFYMPAILVASCVVWAVALGDRMRTAARSRASLRAGIGASGRPRPRMPARSSSRRSRRWDSRTCLDAPTSFT